MLVIRLPEEIEQRLADLAAKTGRSKSFHARETILEHLEELEDAYLRAKGLNAPANRWTQVELEAKNRGVMACVSLVLINLKSVLS